MTLKKLPVDSFSPEDLARFARLRYILDEEPGFARQMNGSGFHYLNGHGRPLRDARHIQRIEMLAIPPAWTDVWICREPAGHLQATGHDARGRKQYIYHEDWRKISNLAKFLRLEQCVKLLPALRQQVTRDLRGRELTKTRVLAGMVAVLDLTSIRIGNEEYVRANDSYGLTTLRTRHVTIEGERAILRFRGKSGLRREVVIEEKRLVRLLRQLKKLRGTHVFQYIDNGSQIRPADAIAVNDYLRERTGYPITAKDFRTWKASALATGVLYNDCAAEKLAARKRAVKKAIAVVSDALGNTPTVCRKYYIHPGLIDTYLDGEFRQMFRRFKPTRQKSFTVDEQLFARFLRRWHQGC